MRQPPDWRGEFRFGSDRRLVDWSSAKAIGLGQIAACLRVASQRDLRPRLLACLVWTGDVSADSCTPSPTWWPGAKPSPISPLASDSWEELLLPAHVLGKQFLDDCRSIGSEIAALAQVGL